MFISYFCISIKELFYFINRKTLEFDRIKLKKLLKL